MYWSCSTAPAQSDNSVYILQPDIIFFTTNWSYFSICFTGYLLHSVNLISPPTRLFLLPSLMLLMNLIIHNFLSLSLSLSELKSYLFHKSFPQ